MRMMKANGSLFVHFVIQEGRSRPLGNYSVTTTDGRVSSRLLAPSSNSRSSGKMSIGGYSSNHPLAPGPNKRVSRPQR